jgi:hypothetical protein
MNDLLEQVYGRGWAFPPRFTLAEGPCMVAGAEDVRQSLVILFSTLPGERIMRDGYGCDLNQFMFANISSALMSEIESEIIDNVLQWESRAEITDLDIGQDDIAPSLLQIEVTYRLRGSDFSATVDGLLDIQDGRSAIQ